MKRALLIVLVLMIISTVWCQNGTPTMPVNQLNFDMPGGCDFMATSTGGYVNSYQKLIKFNLDNGEPIWTKQFDSYVNQLKNVGNGVVLYKTPATLVKISESGDSLWSMVLPSEARPSFENNVLATYSWTGLLTVIDSETGSIITQYQRETPNLGYCASHRVIPIDQNNFYFFEQLNVGVNWNVSVKVTKATLQDNNMEEVWSVVLPDLRGPDPAVKDNLIYLGVNKISPNQDKVLVIKDNGNNFEFIDTLDTSGLHMGVLNDNMLIFSGMYQTGSDPNYEDGFNGEIIFYNKERGLISSHRSSLTDFCRYTKIGISGDRMFSILNTQLEPYGPVSLYLVELTSVYNSAVSTDPDTPTTPQLNITCYPTPTRVGNNVNVKFETKSRDNTTIEVYNIKGQKVRTLVNSNFSSGQHQATWNGRTDNGTPVSSGMYFFRMKSGTYSATKKVILIK